jgi:hypothetical protein
MSDIKELLGAEFDPKTQVLHFQGRGGQTFDYIEDETVMDRLDEVIGVGNWSVEVEPVSVADGIVKVRLTAHVPGANVPQTYEDFGYHTRDGGESLKEAVSDGIRRCGRYLGIGRYLYKKHISSNGNGRAASPSARPPAAPVRPQEPRRAPPAHNAGAIAEIMEELPDEPEWLAATPAGFVAQGIDRALSEPVPGSAPKDIRAGHYGPTCPQHVGRVWHDKYQKCTAKDPDTKSGYCEWRPSKRWIAEHELEGARA